MTTLATGFDVSHWQRPSPALATQRKATGDTYCWIKATDGLGRDRAMAAHHANFGAVGILRGAYHFYRSNRDPIAQAHNLVTATAGLTWELPLCLDYEDGGGRETAQRLLTFLAEVERLSGRVPVLYTGPSWWTSTIGNDSRFARYPLWLAAYPGTTVVPSTLRRAPAPWPVTSVWQWTSANGLDRNVALPATIAALCGKLHEPDSWQPAVFGGRYLIPAKRPTPPMVSQDVAVWGVMLTALGYHGFNMRGSSAKVYGAGKVRATKRFQRNHGLNDDGIVGPVTWGAAVDLLAERRKKR